MDRSQLEQDLSALLTWLRSLEGENWVSSGFWPDCSSPVTSTIIIWTTPTANIEHLLISVKVQQILLIVLITTSFKRLDLRDLSHQHIISVWNVVENWKEINPYITKILYKYFRTIQKTLPFHSINVNRITTCPAPAGYNIWILNGGLLLLYLLFCLQSLDKKKFQWRNISKDSNSNIK